MTTVRSRIWWRLLVKLNQTKLKRSNGGKTRASIEKVQLLFGMDSRVFFRILHFVHFDCWNKLSVCGRWVTSVCGLLWYEGTVKVESLLLNSNLVRLQFWTSSCESSILYEINFVHIKGISSYKSNSYWFSWTTRSHCFLASCHLLWPVGILLFHLGKQPSYVFKRTILWQRCTKFLLRYLLSPLKLLLLWRSTRQLLMLGKCSALGSRSLEFAVPVIIRLMMISTAWERPVKVAGCCRRSLILCLIGTVPHTSFLKPRSDQIWQIRVTIVLNKTTLWS